LFNNADTSIYTAATSGSSARQSPRANLIDFPVYAAAQVRRLASIVLAEWEGSVLEVQPESIVAGLVPIRGVGTDEEAEAEIPWDEIADGDRDLVRPGALFRLSVGYEVANGTRSRFSRVVFRRLLLL